MSDLIRREDALELCCRGCSEGSYGESCKEMCAEYADLAKLPAVDAVEVVRCKDCAYARHWYEYAHHRYRDKCLCYLWDDGSDVCEDGYCNYGMKRVRD